MKVAIFIDGRNFYEALQRVVPGARINYDKLASYITRVISPQAEFAGAYYYTSISDNLHEGSERIDIFLKGLELRQGFFVRREIRRSRQTTCPNCKTNYNFTVEKCVDVRLTVDMLRLAIGSAYDVGVLLSGDEDFVPLLEALVNCGKQIWVATWANELSSVLRTRCFGHINLQRGLDYFSVATETKNGGT